MNSYSSVSCPGCPVDQRLMPTKGCGRPLLGCRCPTTATEASPLISFLASSFLPGFLSLQHRSRQGFCTNTWVGSSCWLHCVAIGGCFASPSGWNISMSRGALEG